jgi:hypothetical protein
VQLQRGYADLQKKGIGLAAISYDPPATLKAFAEARGITFPLLSDTGSATIKAYRLLNEQATGRTAGIPHPGTFVLDRRGVVTSRSFEASYQERATAASIVGASSSRGETGNAETAQLTLVTSASDAVVAPGTRFALTVEITPKPRMHVYSPDQKTYIPVALEIAANDALTVHAPRFPPSEEYLFKPLNERQRVYSRPFRIVNDVTVALTPAVRERARAAGATLTINATLHYQACDDKICYPPASVPLAWTLGLEPLAR